MADKRKNDAKELILNQMFNIFSLSIYVVSLSFAARILSFPIGFHTVPPCLHLLQNSNINQM